MKVLNRTMIDSPKKFVQLRGAGSGAVCFFRPHAIAAVIGTDVQGNPNYGTLLLVTGYHGMLHVTEDAIDVMRAIAKCENETSRQSVPRVETRVETTDAPHQPGQGEIPRPPMCPNAGT